MKYVTTKIKNPVDRFNSRLDITDYRISKLKELRIFKLKKREKYWKKS